MPQQEQPFWCPPPSLDELTKGVPAVTSIEELGGDFWPEDESVEEFIATIRAWRREKPIPKTQ